MHKHDITQTAVVTIITAKAYTSQQLNLCIKRQALILGNLQKNSHSSVNFLAWNQRLVIL